MSGSGTASAVLGVPGTINACIQLCQTIQFARNYEGDFALSKARLAMAGLRLKQWEEALESVVGDGGSMSTEARSFGELDTLKAKEIFDDIHQAFERAEAKSKKYARQRGIQDEEALQKGEGGASADDLGLGLAIRTRLGRRRRAVNVDVDVVPSTGLVAKARWVIYRKAYFDNLLDNICTATNEFVESFPLHQTYQRELLQADISALDQKQLEVVRDPGFVGDDIELQHAADVVAEQRGLVFDNNKVGGRANVNVGNEYFGDVKIERLQTIGVFRSDFSGSSVSRFGHIIGGNGTHR